MLLRQQGGPGTGLFFPKEFCTAWNRTGATLTAGEVVMFDLADTDIDTTTTLTEGADGSVFANVITPTTAGIGVLTSSGTTGDPGYYFGVVVAEQDTLLGGGLDNTKVYLQVRGLCRVSMVATAITVGIPLFAKNGVRTLSPVVVAAGKPLARAWEPNGSAAGIFLCLFDGIDGIGAGPVAS
jgi:hypothetical protein